jgi:uncharacterized protein YegP (UPF0339 family)
MSEARFQVYEDIAGKYRFRLKAPNNKIVAVGEAYERKESCLKGVNAVKKYCGSEIEDLTIKEEKKTNPKFQIFRDVNEKYRFRLRAPNNEIVAASEDYETKEGCLNGIASVKKYCGAEIEDLTAVLKPEAPEEAPIMMPPRERGEITLILEKPLSAAMEGSTINLRGKLIEGDMGLADQRIEIYESDRSFMQDDLMASGDTGIDGSFSIDWKAKKMDWWDDTVEVYARYKEPGSRRLIPIHSEKFIIKIA